MVKEQLHDLSIPQMGSQTQRWQHIIGIIKIEFGLPSRVSQQQFR